MIEVAGKFITRPGQLGEGFTADDGIGMCDSNAYYVHDSIVDLSSVSLDELDEAVAFTLGAHGTIERCVIRGAGKLFLMGAGDSWSRPVEEGKNVRIIDCLLDDFGRRGPEVQCGMTCDLIRCVIRKWAYPPRFTVRSFAAWAHDGGEIFAKDCVFQPMKQSDVPFSQRLKDSMNWIGQSVNDDGLRALFDHKTFIPGRRRALVATSGGIVRADHCWFGGDAYTDSNENSMTDDEAAQIVRHIDTMTYELEQRLINAKYAG